MSTEVKAANPSPVGMMGFGMAAILLNLHNAGLFPNSSVVLAMGLCMGGLAQIIAGFLEFRRGNTFATVAFTGYGLFWFSLVGIWVLPALNLAEAPSATYMGCYLTLWAIFSLFLLLGVPNGGPVLKMVFLTLALLFSLLAVSAFTDSQVLGVMAGYVGMLSGATGMYLAMAEVMHEQYGRKVLPY